MNDRAIRKQRKADRDAASGNTRQCPICKAWIVCHRGRMRLDHHIETTHPEKHADRERFRSELLGL